MSFTQENKINVARCGGCGKRCEIKISNMFPTANPIAFSQYGIQIGEKIIKEYFDNDGILRQISHYPNTPEKAMALARKITRLCDNYKTR